MGTSLRCAGSMAAMVLALTACAQERKLPREVTNSLETCFNRNDAAGCAELFTEDAEIFPHSARVIRGRDAIHEFFADQIAAEFAFDTDSTTQLVREHIAIDQGTYRVRNVMAGKDVELGNYLHVWTRDEGPWKLYRVMYNTEYAPRASVSIAEDVEAAENENPR